MIRRSRVHGFSARDHEGRASAIGVAGHPPLPVLFQDGLSGGASSSTSSVVAMADKAGRRSLQFDGAAGNHHAMAGRDLPLAIVSRGAFIGGGSGDCSAAPQVM